jgi:hypothetical protein
MSNTSDATKAPTTDDIDVKKWKDPPWPST